MKGIAQKGLAALAWLFVLGVLVQFFLAGLGLPQLGGEGMDAHKDFGYSALHFTPTLLIPLAFFAKASRALIVLTFILTVVSAIQPIWAFPIQQGEFDASFHVLGAAVILVMSYEIARMATDLVRSTTA